jgi:hypothetical protein
MWLTWFSGSPMNGRHRSQAWQFPLMAPVFECVANLLVDALYVYGIVGLLFAFAFVVVGVKRVDSQAIGSSIGFRLLTGPNGQRLPKEAFLNRVAQPVRIRGKVRLTGSTLLLETEPGSISPLP